MLFFQSDREDILQVLCKKVNLSDDIDLYSIAMKTNNYTGADLSGLLYSSHSIAENELLNGMYFENSKYSVCLF